MRIAQTGADSRNPAFYQKTLDAMGAFIPVLHQGVLYHEPSKTFGMPDFLIRADILEQLFNIKSEGPKGHYVAVDAKFSTLHILKDGAISTTQREYAAQVWLYSRALGLAQGFTPNGYLLGRGWQQAKSRGDNAFERLAIVYQGSAVGNDAEQAVKWIHKVRAMGPDSKPPAPNMKSLSDSPWHHAKKQIAQETGELTAMYFLNPDKRDALLRMGITSYLDPKLTAEVAGVTGMTIAPRFDAILDVNRGNDLVLPKKLRDGEWRVTEGFCDVFTDFETYSGAISEDFAQLPLKGGEPRIFQSGLGWMEAGVWQSKTYTSKGLSSDAEREIIQAWLDDMDAIQRRLGGKLRVWCYSQAEASNYSEAYNAARVRHNTRNWPEIEWADLLKIIRDEPFVVKGALGFGLKAVAKALAAHGLIDIHWPDSAVADGLGASMAGWSQDPELLMACQFYNEVDTKAMYAVLSYLRKNH